MPNNALGSSLLKSACAPFLMPLMLLDLYIDWLVAYTWPKCHSSHGVHWTFLISSKMLQRITLPINFTSSSAIAGEIYSLFWSQDIILGHSSACSNRSWYKFPWNASVLSLCPLNGRPCFPKNLTASQYIWLFHANQTSPSFFQLPNPSAIKRELHITKDERSFCCLAKQHTL